MLSFIVRSVPETLGKVQKLSELEADGDPRAKNGIVAAEIFRLLVKPARTIETPYCVLGLRPSADPAVGRTAKPLTRLPHLPDCGFSRFRLQEAEVPEITASVLEEQPISPYFQEVRIANMK